ncbi:MAG: hypothetical protein OHK0039_06410 [Bacteroidia bacterium]
MHPLEAKLGQRYALSRQQLVIESEPFDLAVIGNVEALLEALIALGPDHEDYADERIPYWAELWPAAIGMATHILRTRPIAAGAGVLEIGCGLGLPGIAAARLGAQICLTDYLADAVDIAALNGYLNLGEVPAVRLLDWREATPDLAADVLLASDVAYEKRAYAPLLQAFRTLVRPGGKVLLSEPGRTMTQDFIRSLPAEGFAVQTFVYPVLLRGTSTTVQVCEIVPDNR